MGKFTPTHGMSKTRLYKIWAGIISRCSCPSSTSWSRYGGKGIKVCEEWKCFEPFAEWALSNGYTDNLTIDRIDPTKDYCPENCRWASVYEQNNNTKNTIIISYNEETLPLSYWARKLGMNKHTLYERLYRHKWSIEKAFTTPVRSSK